MYTPTQRSWRCTHNTQPPLQPHPPRQLPCTHWDHRVPLPLLSTHHNHSVKHLPCILQSSTVRTLRSSVWNQFLNTSGGDGEG
ncbi:hypothetical protein SORBI_3007G187500 [Sorghum bicolor]|uniref:Uncharacterized protein n=1 Tax=Sorghum bicolor TaxID=4558 RepID=A0A1B6PII0_SORBI|nr:hypothetical protein SORBI_3007G187500 [Sorghum bicolor]